VYRSRDGGYWKKNVVRGKFAKIKKTRKKEGVWTVVVIFQCKGVIVIEREPKATEAIPSAELCDCFASQKTFGSQ